MSVVLFDEPQTWRNLLPLTFTRPVSEIRVGILTIREKWERALGEKISFLTEEYLQERFSRPSRKTGLHINSSICPDSTVIRAVKSLRKGEVLVSGGHVIAFTGAHDENTASMNQVEYNGTPIVISRPWDIFRRNGEAIKADYELLTKNRLSVPLSRSVTVIGRKSQVFMEVGARAEACILNTLDGPVYIGKSAEIMEGSAVRGPFALGERSQLKMNSKVYGPSTIGPYCKVGGEVSNSVIFGYSNKAHDGFLGNSVLGEWCNLGADTNNSNLKNNYGNVKLYSYATGQMEDSGLQFCGLIMGDHSRSGINTMFNTGTVVGVGSNIYGGGFPPTHIPNFQWGGKDGFESYHLDKFFETTDRVYGRRQMKLTSAERAILKEVYDREG
jgi:UDP-N-acetylglucosamine diphosphorylase/glucosamine-1-phosphate N-acetyltransferase